MRNTGIFRGYIVIPNVVYVCGSHGRIGGLTNPCPGAESVEPVIVTPKDLPCLERGHHTQKAIFRQLVMVAHLHV